VRYLTPYYRSGEVESKVKFVYARLKLGRRESDEHLKNIKIVLSIIICVSN
jgi:hypothetical protein